MDTSVQDEIARVKAELKALRKKSKSSSTSSVTAEAATKQLDQMPSTKPAPFVNSQSSSSLSHAPLSAYEAQKYHFLSNKSVIIGKRRYKEEDQTKTMAALAKFKSILDAQTTESEASIFTQTTESQLPPSNVDSTYPSTSMAQSKSEPCRLHNIINCGSCKDMFQSQTALENTSEEGWLAHSLVFDQSAGTLDSRNDPNELVVIDPREKMKDIVQQKKK